MSTYFTHWQLFWQAVILIAYVTLLLAVRHYRPKQLRFDTTPDWRDLARTFGTLVVFAALGAAGLWSGVLSYAARFGPFLSSLVVIYIFCIVAPAEEIIFRGFIQGYLSKRAGIWPAIIITSVIFGLIHLPNGATGIALGLWNWKLAIMAGLAGIGFGWVYARTKSIWNVILLHAILSCAYFLFIH